MRNSLRAIAVLGSPVAIDNLEARVVGKVDVELDSRVLAIPEIGIDALGQLKMSNTRGRAKSTERDDGIHDVNTTDEAALRTGLALIFENR